MSEHQIEYLSPGRLRPYPQNAKTHSNAQIELIGRGYDEVGFLSPIVADENLVILAGHGRLAAAKKRGLKKVPVIVVRGLSEAKKRAYRLADNKLAERSGWDREILAHEIAELRPLFEEVGLDFEWTGFEEAEIDLISADLVDREDDPADQQPPLTANAVSRVGDLWLLNKHRLLCGVSGKAVDISKLMGPDRAYMVFSDPPYNVRVSSIQGRGKRKHREFAMGSGEMSSADYVRFLVGVHSQTAKYSVDGSLHYICIDWRHVGELLEAGKAMFAQLLNFIVWVKNNGGQGSFYRSQHELILVFKLGQGPYRNNISLGRHGRNRTNVWQYAGVNSFRTGRLDDLSVHPTVKPIALVADAIRDCTRRGDLVLDPFMGSGTTILAAERVGRRAYGLEIDPFYVDAAIRRWEAYTGRDAVLSGTAKTFTQLAAERSSDKIRRAK